jgi:hypothetical protein
MRRMACVVTVLLAAVACLFPSRVQGQSASTGAIAGTVTDPSGAVVAQARIRATNEATGVTRTVFSGSTGNYLISLLPPGNYRIEVSKEAFKLSTYPRIAVNVTETDALNIRLQVGTANQTVEVQDTGELLQTETSALGQVTDERMVENLPLVTRNYTQILGLSSGVSGEVVNSAAIGRGETSQSATVGGYSVAGNATNDNNFQMNGSEVNDLSAQGNISGGIPVPNPDAIQEFKVQVGQYDASYGRNAGANVDVVTKSGTNQFHGDTWEYFRNTALNANDYFLKQNKQPRGVLNQNQFGFTLGGPVVKKKLMFFVSYQGTRERDGLDNSGGCLTSGNLPLLTNSAGSRTAPALAQEFAGQSGILGGTIASAADISPTALAVLNAQLPSGGFMIPAPQNSATGESTFSSSCAYTEDQFVSNLDFYHTEKSHLSGKFFFMNSDQAGAFPTSQLLPNVVTVPGFPQAFTNGFRDFSLNHTYAFNDHLLNQAILGFHRIAGTLSQNYSKLNFANSPPCAGAVPGVATLASFCVPAPAFDNPFPNIQVLGGFNVGGNGQGVSLNQNYYDFSDSLTYVHGRHSLHFGGGISRSQINLEGFHFFGGLVYPSFPDFLLGNVFLSIDVPGVFDRAWRVWDGNFYLQDDYRVTSRLSFNLGLRYERQGQLGESLGRAATFDPGIADPTPPPKAA